MLHINDLRFGFGGRVLFDGATAAISAGQKIGLVGRNGTGKSTLFAMIAGEIGPETGTISIQPRARLGRVAQEAPSGATSLLQTVLNADQELVSLQQRLETEPDPNKLAEIHARLADIDAHSAEARASIILSGLGFSQEALARPVGDLSGGWRMRVALASVLFTQPDLLLLDEPTNYLDLEGVIWLKNYLRNYPYTVLIISHDRDLLNAVPTGILHLENGKLTSYRGNYHRFARTRAENLARQAKEHSKQEAKRRHLQSFVDRFKAKASKAKQAQSRVKMLERLTLDAPLVSEDSIEFRFPKPEHLSPPLLSLEDVSVGYAPGKPILKKLNLRLDPEDRIALLGNNGEGKSTFAKLLAGVLKHESGEIQKSKKLTAGHFAQHQLDALTPGHTPYQHMAELMPLAPEAKVRAVLGGFGFTAHHADRKVESLSGGEKARLLFALISRDKPELLILDEPTNHLDIDARQSLLEAINAYEGAVLLISHDWHLVSACADRLWIAEGGTVKPFEGDIDGYAQHILSARKTGQSNGKDTAKGKDQDGGLSAKEQRQLAAEKRKALAPYKRRIEALEKDIDKLNGQISLVETQIADPALYAGDNPENVSKLTKLQQDLAQLQKARDDKEAEWLEAQEGFEQAEAAQ